MENEVIITDSLLQKLNKPGLEPYLSTTLVKTKSMVTI